MAKPKRSRKHKFAFSVSFTRAVTRAEALEAIRNSGSMGSEARDYFTVRRDEFTDVGGEMIVRSVKTLKEV